jgi:hypothetical protein
MDLSIEGTGFISKFSVYRGQPGIGVQLHQYITFFKLSRSLVRLRVHVKFVLEFRGVKTKLCMLSGDMQLFSRNEESVEQAHIITETNVSFFI